MKESVEIDKVESKIDDVEINLKNEVCEDKEMAEIYNNNDYDQEQNAKHEFERHLGNRQTLNGKVFMMNIINYKNSVLNIVSQYTIINNEEKNDHNEIRPKLLETINDNTFTELKWHLFQQFNKYRDVLYMNRNVKNSHQINACMNHIFKNRVLKNNEKLNNAHTAGRDIDEIRDQRFTRPKVLILLPFRNSTRNLVEILIKLSGMDQQEIENDFLIHLE
ncbi:5590_t:CDS:2 [Funneliformis geosporum]|uniref:15702_t:CDS:1 n=1 Tax=Funneliformis geosporum TaxID=1117311 RepID=A0A9W4WPD3_9GLOM|nr:5590_t:CDS:2 [Funneliformis geosporum]CAI2176270.1 15702_t:CDS:2 [Funneliformis geosporum]